MKIVITERQTVGMDVSVDAIYALGEVTSYDNTVTDEDVRERVKDAEVIFANKCHLNESTLKDAKNVKIICEFATGFDNVDIDYCKERGILVCNVRNYSTDAVAQHTFAMLFYLLEKLPFYDNFVKSGEYERFGGFSYFAKTYTEIAGKTWGIIGMGNIGKKVAKIADAMGAKVIFYSASGKSQVTDYERVSFDELIERSDILSLHCPLSDMTRGIINYDALSRMKKSAILLNVARGPVVVDADLAKALNEGLIAAAGLDVTSTEPLTDNNPLSKIKDSERLLITPHMAWASKEARQRCVDEAVENLKVFLDGGKRNAV